MSAAAEKPRSYINLTAGDPAPSGRSPACEFSGPLPKAFRAKMSLPPVWRVNIVGRTPAFRNGANPGPRKVLCHPAFSA
jgi:hypothetical protein